MSAVEDITPPGSACPVYRIEIDPEQLAADLADRERLDAEQAARDEARASALAKLSALGLTDAEIAALLGAS